MSEKESVREKCVNTGTWIEMCGALQEVIINEYGDIQAQRMSHRKKNSSRLQIVAGRFKKNRIVLNHCPFCGKDILTQHKESTND